VNALDQLDFTNRFTSELPADPDERVVPREVTGAAFSRVTPATVSAPALVAHSAEIAALLGISEDTVAGDDFVQVFSGNRMPVGSDSFAMVYGGHQFGNWAGQLGDGRATAIGEIRTPDGGFQTMQLKGAGLTPYSRGADGMAVLRSSVREFLCSEAMHHLGVPTTRALSLMLTGDKVTRDMFYDGNAKPEPGAVVCRVAPSFIRFGNFQLPASRGDLDLLRQLVEFTIRADFPHLLPETPADPVTNELLNELPDELLNELPDELSNETIVAWFAEIVDRTADMIVQWMRVGFVHGVMNTDNMSILGLTIDYGPYGWLDDFDPDWTPNTTDAGQRRYRFGQQAPIAHWNLAQLGSALTSLVEDVEPLQEALNSFVTRYEASYLDMMRSKLGLAVAVEGDEELVAGLLGALTAAETDMTIFHRQLAEFSVDAATPADRLAPLLEAYYLPEQLTDEVRATIDAWLVTYQKRLAVEQRSSSERRTAMNAANPKFVLRNYLAQLAIDAAEEGDNSMVSDLLDVLRSPYDEHPEHADWATKRPDWARSRAGCSQLSCSS
jgi:uncharacterized protein YdiU (UPF0061 family)